MAEWTPPPLSLVYVALQRARHECFLAELLCAEKGEGNAGKSAHLARVKLGEAIRALGFTPMPMQAPTNTSKDGNG